MRKHFFFFFSVVNTECVFGSDWNTRWSETREVFFQKTTLGTKGDEMLSETNLERPGLVWLRTKFRICCLKQSLAIVTQFAYLCFRAVSKSRWFLTPVNIEKLLCGFFSCWKENAVLSSTMLETLEGVAVISHPHLLQEVNITCLCVLVYNKLSQFYLLFSSKVLVFFSSKLYFLFKIMTYQSVFTIMHYLCFISKISKCSEL